MRPVSQFYFAKVMLAKLDINTINFTLTLDRILTKQTNPSNLDL